MKICVAQNCLQIATPAKLNLFLELRSKRNDGFHELETVMCKWSLFDWMSIAPTNDGSIQLTVRKHRRLVSQDIPSDENNLVVKSLRIMRDLAGRSVGARIKLFKRIPIQAGLGGASSNAAGAIWGANHLWNLNWPTERLKAIAAKVGSDVAFFLECCIAKCTGRGEQVYNLNYPRRLNVVVVKPRFGLSTSQIYSRCVIPDGPINSEAILSGLRSGQISRIGKALFNRLEQFADNEHFDIVRMRTEFSKTNCRGHQLTGSGSCYFGLYSNVKSMRAAARQLSSRMPDMSVMIGETLSSRIIDVGTLRR